MAEYSYEQVMTALRNADAAGDTEAASRLASIASGLKSTQTPPQEPSLLDKVGQMLPSFDSSKAMDFVKNTPQMLQDIGKEAVGTGEAALATGTGMASMLTAGTVGGLQGILDSVRDGNFGTQKGVEQARNKFHEYSDTLTYSPRTKAGQEQTQQVGQFVNDVLVPSIGAAPEIGMLSRFAKPTAEQLAVKLNQPKVTPKKSNAFMDAVLAKDTAKQVDQGKMPTQQAELDLGQPNQYGHRPSEFTLDENGIPIRRNASLEAQETVRGGDLFSLENQATELRNDVLNRAEPTTEGVPGGRDYLKAQEEELAYQQKAKQDSLFPEESVAEPRQTGQGYPPEDQVPLGQRGFGRGQRGSVGFFGKDPYEKFVEQMKADYPQATPEQVKRAWDLQQQFEQKTQAEQTKAEALGKMAGKVGSGLADYLSVWEDKTPEAVIDVINKSPDNSDTSLGFLSNNLLSKGRLGVVRHENAGVRDGVALMDKIINNNRIEGNRLLNNQETGVNALARKMETLYGEGEAGEVFKQIFAKQENPEFAFDLNPNQTKLLEAIKKTTDTIWDSLIKTVSKLDAAKAETLSRMKQEWYLPHQFYGDFVSYVRDADGKLLTYIAENSEKDAQRAVEHLREQLGSEYKIDDAVYVGSKSKALGRKADEAKRGAAIQEGFAGQFDYMIDLLGSSDPAVIKAQKAVQSVINRRALASEGMKNRMKVNTNVGGSIGNKAWKSDRENYFDAKKTFENYVQSFYEWKSNMDNAEFLATVREKAPDKVNTYATLKEQFGLISGLSDKNTFSLVTEAGNSFAKINWPGIGRVSPKVVNDGARAIANFEVVQMTGAWNPIMAYQNFVQSPVTQISTMAQVAAHGGSFNPARAFGHILASIPDSLSGGKTNKAWRKYAIEHEIALPNLVESHGKTKMGSAAKEWGLAKSTQVSEQTSRIGFFYGMTKYLMEAGLPEAKALEVSKNMTREYMVNYNRESRPGLLTRTGAVGELAGKLQVFTTNALTQFAQITAEAAKGLRTGNPRLLVPLGVIVATQYLVGGMNGTIPMDVAEKLHWASVKAGVIPPEFRSPRQYMLQEHPKIATSPQSRLIGDWFEGSFRGSLPYTGAPAPQKFVEQLSQIPTAVKWIGDFLTGSNTVSSIDKASTLQAILPASVRGKIEKTYLMNKNDVMVSKNTGNPLYKMPKEEQDDFTSNTNVRSYERGRIGELSSLEFLRQSRVIDARKAIDKQFNEKVADAMNMGEKLDPKFVKHSIKRDFELGGDMDVLVRKAIDKAVKANLPNSIVAELIRDEKNPFKQQRMMQTYKAIQQETR